MRLETGKKYKCLVTYDHRAWEGYISKGCIVTLDSTFVSEKDNNSRVRFDNGSSVPLDIFLSTFEEQCALPF